METKKVGPRRDVGSGKALHVLLVRLSAKEIF